MSKNRKSRTRNWVGRQSRDTYVKRAKEVGYASRAAFKLEEIDRRERIFKSSMKVIDLGAAPGSWSQYISTRVGEGGKIIAVDRDEFVVASAVANVTMIRGDICEPTTQEEIEQVLSGGLADVVVSDMAPDITGIRDTDEAHFDALLVAVEQVLRQNLRAGGRLVVKLFQGQAADAFRARIGPGFDRISARKPVSSRSKSREYFASANGYRRSPAS